MSSSKAPTEASTAPMSQSQIIKALVGMLLAMITAVLSSTIVSTALPTIITDLHGSQSQYVWIVTATLLASTASTPIWGKLADLVSKKLLVQIATSVFTVGSVLAGFAQTTDMLIAWRAFQGLGLGGLQALIVIVIAAMVSPRQRGKYMGPIAAVMSVATVAGPLVGGLIVDSWLGWRWCFFAGVPLAVVALVVVQRTLNLPVIKREVKIDYLGAGLIAGGVCALLIWVSMAGKQFAWASTTSYSLVIGGAVLLALAIVVETRVAEPVIPLRLFKDRTTVLATLASVTVGIAMFGGAVFLGQYFQIARAYSPTAAGLLMLPMIVASTVTSAGSGVLITKFGRWKGFLVAGGVLMVAGFGLLGTIDGQTNIVLVGIYLFFMGAGLGMMMQNLVLAVQNSVPASELGVASSMVTFFRSMAGTVGVSVLGAVLDGRVAELIASGLARIGIDPTTMDGTDVGIGSLNELPPPLRDIVRDAYGDGTGTIFMVATVLAVITLVLVLCIKEVPLNTKSGIEQQQQEQARQERAETPEPVNA